MKHKIHPETASFPASDVTVCMCMHVYIYKPQINFLAEKIQYHQPLQTKTNIKSEFLNILHLHKSS